MALRDGQQYEGAVRFLTVAAAMRPESAGVWLQLGCALGDQGRLEEAVAACRRAVALKPDYVTAHSVQGGLLEKEGRLEEAAAVWRKVIALKSDWAWAHHSLGRVLQFQGEFARALTVLQRGRELCSRDRAWATPFAQQVMQCQRWIELEERLPAVLRGELQPTSPAERCEYALVCYYKRQYGVAARLWADAFAADPQVLAHRNVCYHHDAACAAAQAAMGAEEDAGPSDDTARLSWRKQALEWLRADLTACGKLLENNRAKDRSQVRQLLQCWRYEPDLAGLRDPAAVARLPAAEKKACQLLWKDVEALLHTTDSAR
jgi:serine/threonine-protein kinase